jgi:hypothetical protein
MLPFKLFRVKKEKGGVITNEWVARSGAEGTGTTLPYTCGFCTLKDGTPFVAFRSRRERRRHANDCRG